MKKQREGKQGKEKAPKRMRSAESKIKTKHRKGDPNRQRKLVSVNAMAIPADVKCSAKMADFEVVRRDRHGNALLWAGPNGVKVNKPEYDAIHRDRVNMMVSLAG